MGTPSSPGPGMGYPIPSLDRGYPIPGLGLGYLTPGLNGRVPLSIPTWNGVPPIVWMGYPLVTWMGYPISWMGTSPVTWMGYPISWMGYLPGHLDGVPPVSWIGWGCWGTPLPGPGMGYPSRPDLEWVPPPSRCALTNKLKTVPSPFFGCGR